MAESRLDIVLKTRADLRQLKQTQQELKSIRGIVSQGFVQRIGQRGFDSVSRLPGMLAGAAKRAIDFNAQMETLTLSFRTLLGSAEAADKRIKNLTDFAASTPFQIREIADASRLLQALTGDALSSGEGLRVVGDAAAAAGRGFNETAMWVGRLYQALKGGMPMGEPLMRLTEMGLVTADMRKELEALSGTARSEQETWSIIQRTFSGTAGAMQLQAESFSGMVSTLKDDLNILAGELAGGPFEQLKAGLETILILMGKMDTAVDKQLRERLGEIQTLRMEVAGATTETAAGIVDRLDKRIKAKELSLQSVMKSLHRLEQLERMPTSELLEGMDMFGGGAPLMDELTRLRGLEPGQEVTQLKGEIAALKIQRDKLESMTREQKVTNEIKQDKEEQLSLSRQYVKQLELAPDAAEKELSKLREARRTDAERLEILKERRAELLGAPITLSLAGGTTEGVEALGERIRSEVELINTQISGLEARAAQQQIKTRAAVTEQLIEQARIERQMATERGDGAKVEQLVAREKELIGELIAQYRALADQIRAADPAKAARLDTTIAALEAQQQMVGGNDTAGVNTIGAGYGDYMNSLTDSQGVATQTFNLMNAGFDSLSTNIQGLVNGTQSWGEVFANVGQSIIDQIIQMTIKAAAFAALYSIFGAGTGGLATGPLALLGLHRGGLAGRDGTKLALPGFASGGYTGEGGVFDPAGIVHAGEYVFPAATVNRIGLPTLDAMRGGADAPGGSGKPQQYVFVDNRSDARRLQDDPEFETQVIDIMRRRGGGR